MQCSSCENTAVISSEIPLCRNHFIAHFEGRVKMTIERFLLLRKTDRIAVACSGGKDSTVLLSLLKRWGYEVEALAIDEGIAGYRDGTLDDLRRICNKLGVKLSVVSYEEQFGTTLDSYLKGNPTARPCTSCGVWRRHLLNKFSRGYDAIATGHNLDDEAQSVLMNILRANIAVLARLGPRSGIIDDAKFTPRIKPLYLTPEKEVAAYALLTGLSVSFTECPNAADTFRSAVRDELNELEAAQPGSKRNLIEWFLGELPRLRDDSRSSAADLRSCEKCGEPTTREVCKSCSQSQMVRIGE